MLHFTTSLPLSKSARSPWISVTSRDNVKVWVPRTRQCPKMNPGLKGQCQLPGVLRPRRLRRAHVGRGQRSSQSRARSLQPLVRHRGAGGPQGLQERQGQVLAQAQPARPCPTAELWGRPLQERWGNCGALLYCFQGCAIVDISIAEERLCNINFNISTWRKNVQY